MYASRDMKHDRQVFCHFGSFFTLYWSQKSKFGKNEENAQIYYYHLTHLYHKWKSYDVCFFRYGMQQTEFLSFWAIFCLFTPLTIQKIKIFQIQKRHLKISWFYTSVPKTMIIYHDYLLYFSWHVACEGCDYYFSIFALLHALQLKKLKLRKKNNKKTPRDFIILHICTKNHDQMMCSSCDDDGARQMVRQIDRDGWKKWHIEVGAPPKKS